MFNIFWALTLFILGRILPMLRHYCGFGSHHPLTWRSLQITGRKQKHNGCWIAYCLPSDNGTSISDTNGVRKDLALPDNLLRDAHILYCTSPAMGHNKVSSFQCFNLEQLSDMVFKCDELLCIQQLKHPNFT